VSGSDVEDLLPARQRVEELERCLSIVAVEKQRADNDITELAEELRKARRAPHRLPHIQVE
jgi:hypothetical protein